MVVEEYEWLYNRPRQPHVALYRPPLLAVDDRDGALVRLKVVKRQHVVSQAAVHRPHQVGHAVEPALYGRLPEFDAQPLVHPYLAVERQVVGILSDDELGEQRCAGIALGEGFRGDGSCDDGAVRLAHGLVADGHPDPYVGGCHLKVFGSLHGIEQHPVLLVPEVAQDRRAPPRGAGSRAACGGRGLA